MQRSFILLFGIAVYGVFFLTFLYLIAFVGNVQLTPLAAAFYLDVLVPFSIDAGRAMGHPALAVMINLTLIVLFGMQHSLMARSGFKSWLKRRVPAAVERSIFVLIASLVLLLLMWQWRPLTAVVWQASDNWGQALGWSVFALGFALVLLATFLIDHFELFGLKQVWSQFRRREPRAPQFTTPLLYRLVRHPLYLGFLLAFWGTPTMTVGHLLFASAMTAYILIAVRFEERDLLKSHGTLYERYREQVPMIVPLPKIRNRGVVQRLHG